MEKADKGKRALKRLPGARAREMLDVLEKTYPNARSGLRYGNAFQLLVAAILSAQTTDKQVNRITKDLFSRFPAPEDFAALEPEELEPYIKSCGVYRNKAKNIVGAARMLVERFGSEVPSAMDALMQLPGVGRKTANVVRANAFGEDAIAVDTHVFRVANRLGLADAKDVLHTERDLMKSVPREKWSRAHHWLIWHGRMVCRAQNPKCGGCPLRSLCRHYAGTHKSG